MAIVLKVSLCGARDIPLNKESLELAQRRRYSQLDARSRHERGDICKEVSKRRVEDQSVDRFSEFAVEQEGCDDESSAGDREDRGYLLCNLQCSSLSRRNRHCDSRLVSPTARAYRGKQRGRYQLTGTVGLRGGPWSCLLPTALTCLYDVRFGGPSSSSSSNWHWFTPTRLGGSFMAMNILVVNLGGRRSLVGRVKILLLAYPPGSPCRVEGEQKTSLGWTHPKATPDKSTLKQLDRDGLTNRHFPTVDPNHLASWFRA